MFFAAVEFKALHDFIRLRALAVLTKEIVTRFLLYIYYNVQYSV